MPRDATGTRARLLAEAERLFASRGIHEVTNREITEAAGQRNVSALNYHFGSRDDLLVHILRAHGEPLDVMRGELSAGLDEAAPTHDVVAVLVQAYGSQLATPSGRSYLRIVDQLRGSLSTWRRGPTSDDVHLQRLLGLLAERPEGLAVELREQRLVSMMMLMTAAMAERARQVDAGRPVSPDEVAFLANLADMLVGILHAPVSTAV